jgi:hypothetical protein
VDRRDTETEDRPPARIIRRRIVRPSPVVRKPKVEPSAAFMRVNQEREVALGQSRGARIPVVAAHDRESAAVVVCAVPVGTPRDRTQGVLGDPHIVGEARDVVQ